MKPEAHVNVPAQVEDIHVAEFSVGCGLADGRIHDTAVVFEPPGKPPRLLERGKAEHGSTLHVVLEDFYAASPGFPADKLVTHILGLHEIKDAFDMMARGETLRVVLKP